MEEKKHQKTNIYENHERSIIILGSKNVGKTTLINRFLEKDEKPKPTVAMDYSFGRKVGKSLMKNIVHIWEIGYLTSSLVSSAITGSSLTHPPSHITILVMLDLSKLELLWTTLEETLSILHCALKMSFDTALINELTERRINERTKDSDEVTSPFPINMCILGGKYDEFQEFDFDKKELVGNTLRAVAHYLGAGLHYHSSKDKVIARKTKDVLNHYGFGASMTEAKFMDYTKPLTIMADSFASMNLQLSYSRPSGILDSIKQTYVASIQQESKTSDSIYENPSNDPNFNEPAIDRLKAQRDEVIDMLLHDMLEGRIEKIPIPDPC